MTLTVYVIDNRPPSCEIVHMERSRRTQRLYEYVGQQVLARRHELEMTQESLAKQVGASRTSITNLERGKQHVPLHQLLAIAEELGVDLHDLLPTRAELADEEYVPNVVRGVPQEPPPQTARFISTLLKRAEEGDNG